MEIVFISFALLLFVFLFFCELLFFPPPSTSPSGAWRGRWRLRKSRKMPNAASGGEVVADVFKKVRSRGVGHAISSLSFCTGKEECCQCGRARPTIELPPRAPRAMPPRLFPTCDRRRLMLPWPQRQTDSIPPARTTTLRSHVAAAVGASPPPLRRRRIPHPFLSSHLSHLSLSLSLSLSLARARARARTKRTPFFHQQVKGTPPSARSLVPSEFWWFLSCFLSFFLSFPDETSAVEEEQQNSEPFFFCSPSSPPLFLSLPAPRSLFTQNSPHDREADAPARAGRVAEGGCRGGRNRRRRKRRQRQQRHRC